MHWDDQAILLSVKKHGEHQARVAAFCRQHGVYASIARGAYSKKQRGIYQPGNIVSVKWNARLPEHMGNITAEMHEPVTAFILADAAKLAALSSLCSLVEMILPERHPYPDLYEKFYALLLYIKSSDAWHEQYVLFELELLAQSGFGLDLTSCAANGQTDDLQYVSPKSGRAVCAEAGAPYKDRLFMLPSFLLAFNVRGEVEAQRAEGGNKSEEILAGLRLSGYFLDAWLLEPHGKTLPVGRRQLIEMIEKRYGKTKTD